MSQELLKTPGSVIRFSTYDNVDGVKSFEGEVLTIFLGKAHPNPSEAKSSHINIYPTLPEAVQELTPNDYREYSYFTLQKADGSTVNIGMPWVVDVSISEVTERKAVITLGDFSDDNGERVRKILVQNGYVVDSVRI